MVEEYDNFWSFEGYKMTYCENTDMSYVYTPYGIDYFSRGNISNMTVDHDLEYNIDYDSDRNILGVEFYGSKIDMKKLVEVLNGNL